MNNSIIKEDVLKQGFKNLKIELSDDKDGKQDTTLIFRNSNSQTKKAILYVHGYIDYFFQTELTDHFNEWGYNFYAVDLRKYGRSLMPHHHPNYISDIKIYFEEIDLAIEQIKADGNTNISLMGHSTGGLITSLYTHYTNNKIDKLILNSPFFDLNVSPLIKVFTPIVAFLGSIFPYGKTSGLSELYPASIHKDYKGEWNFNIDWKPPSNFPTYLGWIRAISIAQTELQAGLKIKCPVLVMFSDKSYKGKSWDDIIFTSDAVLDVKHIKKYADNIGKDITKIEIKNGIHDLVLSQKDVRDNVYKQMKIWVDKH